MSRKCWLLRIANVILALAVLPALRSEASLPIQLVGQWGGERSGLAVSGNRAYVSVGASLIVMDISNPSRPVEMGRSGLISGGIQDFAVSGNYIYIASCFEGLQIVDVSDPCKPVYVGRCRVRLPAFAVAVSGGYAYVCTDAGLLLVIDVSDPTGPFLVGGCAFSGYGNTTDIVASGDSVYICNGYYGFCIIDVSDPANPQEVGYYGETSFFSRIVVSGRYAYYICDSGLQIIDVSNPANPQKVGEYPSGFSEVAVEGAHVFLSSAELCVIDVSDPTKPVLEGKSGIIGGLGHINVSGNIIYGLNYYLGLCAVDVSTPSKITYTSTGGSNSSLSRSIAFSGNHVYLTDDLSGLHVLDVSNPTKPIRTGSCDLSEAYDITVADQYAYAAVGERGIEILDVSDSAAPHVVYKCSTTDYDNAYGIAVSSNKAYIARGSSGLEILDVTDRSNPVKIGQFKLFSGMSDVVVSGNYAYTVGWQKGLTAFDVSNPTNPIPRNSCPTEACKIAISGDYIYAAGDNAGLQIFDISDPSTPVEVGRCDTQGRIISVAVSGDRAWVYDVANGIEVIDISNPLSPELLVTANFLSVYPSGIGVSGDYAYIADPTNGMLVLQASQNSKDTIPPSISDVSVDRALVASGDIIHVDVAVADNVGVTGVTADGVSLVRNGDPGWMGIVNWAGNIPASPQLGMHRIRVNAVDAAGNTFTDSAEMYKTTRIVGTSVKGVYDAIMSSASQNFLFKLWGKVSEVQEESLKLDDGTGNPVSVYAGEKFTCVDGDYISVTGVVYQDGNANVLAARAWQLLMIH